MKLGPSRVDETAADRFRAFVSYSHADARIARKLHRKIEAYRLPARVRSGGDGAANDRTDGRLGRIFRDREDLSAAQDLSEAVKAALSTSQALIVLCSPDARTSPWVGQEISLFRALHPDRPILAALVRGEPEESFPDLLLQDGAEPLAADLRKEGDGWRLGFLKIVAGIAGVPLDALVQRDAARRVRRVMAVTGGALVALLAMIGMTIFAIQSRNEAQHQQAEAEGLVEYMLTDLRAELKGVGRLDVMTDVNERAMDYYEDQGDLTDMPAESLERRARILHAMGEDDEKRGDLGKALAKFTQAHRVTEALLARDPNNPDRIFAHAQSEYWVGRVYELRSQWKSAFPRYSAYANAAEKLIAIDSDNPDFLMERGWSYLNLGILEFQSRSGNNHGRRNFEQAIAWMARAADKKPNDSEILKEIGNAYAWLADGYFLKDDLNRYLTARQKELETKEHWLAVDSKSTAAQYAVAKAKFAIAIGRRKLGNEGEARQLLNDANNILSKLVAVDPANKDWAEMARKIEYHQTRNREIEL
ncbi:toll/interleukin-1 receptor domain-containing protein [Parasphingorhabdus sp.]|uniref:toll/interleukin-1 receptor domain-containing protein n=1 Tax=Parasphingorhabdus sp. TaxID=2709688 RepID=UPI003A8D64D7